MDRYREFQFGWYIFLVIVPAQIFFVFAWLFQFGNHPINTNQFVLVSCILLAIELLFCGMTVTLEDSRIKIAFGIGLIHKSVGLDVIDSVSVVNTSWIYGWGIRMIPHGWLYNITGTAGVEIGFKNKSRIIRIGSKHPEKLRLEISERISVS